MRAFGLLVATLLGLIAGAMLLAWAMGWESGDWGDTRAPHYIWLGTLSALMASGVLAAMRQNVSQTLFALLAWCGVFLLLILAYSFRAEFGALWARIRGEVFPSEVIVSAPGEVQLRRSADGHFHAAVALNGVPVSMMVDTGASGIVLTWADARAAGIDPETLVFSERARTAAGTITTAPVRLGRIELGPIARTNLAASVLPEEARQSLLGLDFLNTLRSYEISGDTLTLRF